MSGEGIPEQKRAWVAPERARRAIVGAVSLVLRHPLASVLALTGALVFVSVFVAAMLGIR